MKITELEWDELPVAIPQDYLERGLELLDGGAPWLFVDENDDLKLSITESFFCEKSDQWIFTDIEIGLENLLQKLCKVSEQLGDSEEFAEEKQQVVRGLKKLIEQIESA